MARPKKTLDPNKAFSVAVSKMGELDPKFLIIVTAAGIAGFAGQKGPLTTIMSGLTGNDINGKPNPGLELLGGLAFSPLFGKGAADSLVNMFTPPQNADQNTLAQYYARVGIAGANVVEAAVMYQLVSNPETFKAMLDMAKQSATGAIGLVKGVAAIA